MEDDDIKSKVELCNLIAAISPSASKHEVSKKLDPFYHASVDHLFFEYTNHTPLMIACDYAQENVLLYMRDHPSLSLWGSPSQRSASTGNTALHHSAISGCRIAIDVLQSMCTSNEETPFLDLLQLVNFHKDTVYMMSAAYGHLDFLKQLPWNTQLIQNRNRSADSALTLACGHGHYQIIQYLLSSKGVRVTYDDVEICRQKMATIDAVLEHHVDDQAFHRKRNNVKRGLVILQVELARTSQQAMEGLLKQENEEERLKRNAPKDEAKEKDRTLDEETKTKIAPTRNSNANSIQTGRQDNLKSNSAQQQQQQQQDAASMKEQKSWEQSSVHKNESVINSTSLPKVRTLVDGTVVSLNTKVSNLLLQDESLPTSPLEGKEPNDKVNNSKSIDELLRDTLASRRTRSDGVDAMMESLCLDATMLLLNSHKMAMDLSPSQLEAIEQILRTQIATVNEAQTIQERVRSSGEL